MSYKSLCQLNDKIVTSFKTERWLIVIVRGITKHLLEYMLLCFWKWCNLHESSWSKQPNTIVLKWSLLNICGACEWWSSVSWLHADRRDSAESSPKSITLTLVVFYSSFCRGKIPGSSSQNEMKHLVLVCTCKADPTESRSVFPSWTRPMWFQSEAGSLGQLIGQGTTRL